MKKKKKKKKKKKPGDIISTKYYNQMMYWFLRYGAQLTDGQMNGRTDGRAESDIERCVPYLTNCLHNVQMYANKFVVTAIFVVTVSCTKFCMPI